MSINDHVLLTILADAVNASRAGFGGIGILSHNCDFPEKSRTYADSTEVAVDWDSDSPEYLAAAKVFGASPKVPSLKILNANISQPTQQYTLAVADIQDEHVYEVTVAGEGFDEETVEITSGVGATNDAILAALVVALNAVVGKTYTAAVVVGAGDTDTMTVTGNAPGNWFSVQVVDVTDLSIFQSHADPDVADDLDAIVLEDSDWYWLITLYNSEAYVLEAALWANTNEKMYYFASNATADLGTSTGTAGIGDKIRAFAYRYAAGDYHPNPKLFADAALVGNLAARSIGSWTAKFKRRTGVTTVPLTSQQRANLNERQMNYYEVTKGLNLTSEGTTAADGVYKFIDNVVNLDWLRDTIATNVFTMMNSLDKIPYTDAGAALVEAQIRAALAEGIRNGVLTDDTEPTVTVPLMADVSAADRALRILPDVEFTAVLAGAIHKVLITGTVSP
jgi:hypothetical protein